MTEAFGVMEGAYFVSKNDLLIWINNLLKLNLTKIEQLGTGAVYSQILDACFPGEIDLHKLNWKARLEWEFINNFKVLQQGFEKLKIKKDYEVKKLVKAKFQDNLEFGQWMKKFYERKFGNEINKDYDPVARRENVEPDFSFTENKIPTKANLNYHNYQWDSSKKGKPKSDTSRKAREKSGFQSFNEEKENNSMLDNQKLKDIILERDSLKEKIEFIQDFLKSSIDKSNSLILKEIRDYLGIMQTNKSEKNLLEVKDKEDKGANEEGDELQESGEVIMLIDGESI